MQGRESALESGAGTNLRYLDGLGATCVAGPLTTCCNDPQTGVISGVFLWPEAAVRFKLVEVAPNMLKADRGAVNTKLVTANTETWKRLPDEVKKVIQDVFIAYRDRLAKLAAANGRESEQEYAKTGGTVKSAVDDPTITLYDILAGAFPFAMIMLLVLIAVIAFPALSLALL